MAVAGNHLPLVAVGWRGASRIAGTRPIHSGMMIAPGDGIGQALGDDGWVWRRRCGAMEGWVVMRGVLCVRAGLQPDLVGCGAGASCASGTLLDVDRGVEVLAYRTCGGRPPALQSTIWWW